MKAFHRYAEEAVPHTAADHTSSTLPLTLREAKLQIQDMIKPDTSLIIETGDRYFHSFFAAFHTFLSHFHPSQFNHIFPGYSTF